MDKVLLSYLEHLCGRENVGENVLLSGKTTFRIGGPARYFVTVPTKEILLRLISALRYIEQRYFIIGMGSNVLASDAGFNGVVIKLGFNEILDNGCFIYADAGVRLSQLCTFAGKNGLSGLEFAYGIPATVGGAVYMNAGAYGGSMSDVVIMVDVLAEGEMITLEGRDLRFSYRNSVFQGKPDWVILGAYFFLKPDDPSKIIARGKENLTKRRATQPAEPNAGSVFKRMPSSSSIYRDNDVEFIPSKVIDELGLKGTRIGDAEVSTKHAGFIVNKGSATAKDVKRLIRLIKRKIREKHGVKLVCEIKELK